ncbi:cupredoxin domain-containing protein [Leeia sp. TBRC 13508]|uniref:Cupredoxin domain-containing protein n=1 Tax=Leeia speluncae TaxID=2884804 RepID=A0ABS8D4Q6_9NEIS|nr:cupredoxin domain-containing protein [Leeia speluncae]MCB6183173.1 cupredoxin domain-containing protein [Leeia speluncae]
MKKLLVAVLLSGLAAVAHAEDAQVYKLDIKDGVLTPQKLEVPADKAFKIEVKNSGKTAAEFESIPLKKEKVIAPGATSIIAIKALKAGEYKFVDEFHENQPTAQGKIVAK